MAIHGDKTQQERDYVMSEFRAGRISVMIATDVAARGIGTALSVPAPRRCASIPNRTRDTLRRLGLQTSATLRL